MSLAAKAVALILCSLQLQAQLITMTLGTGTTVSSSSAGADTNHLSVWTPAGGGGNFNGGHVFGPCLGDGAWSGGTGYHIQFCEVTAFGPAVVTQILALSDYKQTAQNGCFGDNAGIAAGNYSHSAGLHAYSVNGTIYLFIQCQTDGDPFETFATLLIASCDNGAHWTNYANWKTNTNACASPGSTTGDVPTAHNSTNVQWANPAYTKAVSWMGKATLVQIAQDGATPPVIPGVDTTYNYFISNNEVGSVNTTHQLYCHRVLKSVDQMPPTNWSHWNGTTWVADASIATVANIMPSGWASSTIFSQGAFYTPELGKFIMLVDGAFTIPYPFATADFPWGPWTIARDQSPQKGKYHGYGFTTPILASKAAITNGISIWVATDGNNGDLVNMDRFGFQQLLFTRAASPIVTGVQ